MFIDEFFKEETLDSIDDETLTTIRTFFENNLNLSETSRQLYVHRRDPPPGEGLHQSSHAGSHGRETGQHDQKTRGSRQEAGCQTGKEGPKWMIG